MTEMHLLNALASGRLETASSSSSSSSIVDPWKLAIDAVLGQLAFGSCADAVPEFWLYEHPAGGGAFVQPPNSGDAALTAIGVGAGILGQQAQHMIKEYFDSNLRHSAAVHC